MVGGPSIVLTLKAVLDQTVIRDSTNLCKSFVGIDASQLYPFFISQTMPRGLYRKWGLGSESGNFTPRKNKTRSFENMVLSYFQRVRPQCKVESFYTTGTQRKIDAYSVDGFGGHCNFVFEAMGCYDHFSPSQEARLFSLRKKFSEALKRERWTSCENNTYKKSVIASLRCTNVISGTCTGQIRLLGSMCGNFSPTKCLSQKKNRRRISNLEVYLVMFNVVLKYPRIFEKLLPTFHPSPKRLRFVEMTLVPL